MLHEIQSKLLTCSHVQFPIQCDVCASRLELLLQRANKIQNMALDCEEKLTLAKNTLQAVSAEHFSSYILHRFTDTDRVRGLMLGKCTIIWSVTAQRGAYKLSGASVLLGEEIFPLLFQSGKKYTFKQKPDHVPPLLLVPRTCPGQRAARRCSVRGSWPATCRTASLWSDNSTRSSKSSEMRNTTRWSSSPSGESKALEGLVIVPAQLIFTSFLSRFSVLNTEECVVFSARYMHVFHPVRFRSGSFFTACLWRINVTLVALNTHLLTQSKGTLSNSSVFISRCIDFYFQTSLMHLSWIRERSLGNILWCRKEDVLKSFWCWMLKLCPGI